MDRQFITVALFSLYCVIYGSIRYFLEGDAWGFLHHNLWLGWLPLLVAGIVRWKDLSGYWLAACWVVWLIFLPNAPYIVTDLIHMRGITTLPWFDLILIFHFALAGLLAGALALKWMQGAVSKALGQRKAISLSVFAILLSGIGMAMGRDLRLKSEEVFSKPFEVWMNTFQGFDATSLIKAAIYAGTFGVFYLVFLGLSGNRQSIATEDG
ncbi:MAG: DUF1361 domain-containing protein [Verrucomicrobiales bacterium]